MTTVLEPRTATPTSGWWTCPDWCDPTKCWGGDTFHGITTARIHTRIHYTHAGVDPDRTGRTTVVELVTTQAEDIHLGPEPAVKALRIGDHAIAGAEDFADGLAAALTAT